MGHVEHAVEVDRHDVLPVLDHRFRLRGEGVAAVDAGIVDQDRDLADRRPDLRGNLPTPIPPLGVHPPLPPPLAGCGVARPTPAPSTPAPLVPRGGPAPLLRGGLPPKHVAPPPPKPPGGPPAGARPPLR